MIVLSIPRPHARTGHSKPSNGLTTSGLNMPAPPTSIHLFFFGCHTSHSQLGSVYGKCPGLILTSGKPIFAKNSFRYPFRCLKFAFGSMTIPSTCMNSNRDFHDNVSFLNTFPTEKNFAGISDFFSFARVCADKTVLCVLSKFSFAISSDHLYCQPLLPVANPFSCAAFTFITMSFGNLPYFGSLM